MWDEQKRSRFEQLRQQQRTSVLTEAERAELALHPGTGGRRSRSPDAGHATAPAGTGSPRIAESRLEVLALRKEAMRAAGFAISLPKPRPNGAIDGELAAVLAGSRGSKTDE